MGESLMVAPRSSSIPWLNAGWIRGKIRSLLTLTWKSGTTPRRNQDTIRQISRATP